MKHFMFLKALFCFLQQHLTCPIYLLLSFLLLIDIEHFSTLTGLPYWQTCKWKVSSPFSFSYNRAVHIPCSLSSHVHYNIIYVLIRETEHLCNLYRNLRVDTRKHYFYISTMIQKFANLYDSFIDSLLKVIF